MFDECFSMNGAEQLKWGLVLSPRGTWRRKMRMIKSKRLYVSLCNITDEKIQAMSASSLYLEWMQKVQEKHECPLNLVFYEHHASLWYNSALRTLSCAHQC